MSVEVFSQTWLWEHRNCQQRREKTQEASFIVSSVVQIFSQDEHSLLICNNSALPCKSPETHSNALQERSPTPGLIEVYMSDSDSDDDRSLLPKRPDAEDDIYMESVEGWKMSMYYGMTFPWY